jgi:hypothetical protein
MENLKKIFIKLLIVLLSLISADGGRSFILAGNSLQILMNHDHHNDAQLPHNHHLVSFVDDEKWIDPVSNDFFSVNNISNYFLDNQDAPVGDYSGSVWLPPKFI